MNPFRLVQTAGILTLMAGGLTSCLKEPSYPETPSISFERIERRRFTLPSSTVPIDSVYITIGFEDGDGDLGLTATEAQSAPYGSKGVAAVNFINTAFIKNTKYANLYDSARQVVTYLPKRDLYSLFGHLSPSTDSRKAPLKGTLTRAYGFYLGSPYLPNQTLKFRVSILDRALHRSNEIVTDSIVIAPR